MSYQSYKYDSYLWQHQQLLYYSTTTIWHLNQEIIMCIFSVFCNGFYFFFFALLTKTSIHGIHSVYTNYLPSFVELTWTWTEEVHKYEHLHDLSQYYKDCWNRYTRVHVSINAHKLICYMNKAKVNSHRLSLLWDWTVSVNHWQIILTASIPVEALWQRWAQPTAPVGSKQTKGNVNESLLTEHSVH